MPKRRGKPSLSWGATTVSPRFLRCIVLLCLGAVVAPPPPLCLSADGTTTADHLPEQHRYALVLIGGVSRAVSDSHTKSASAWDAKPVDIGVVAAAVERHILSVNDPRPDVFIHSWATAEEAWLRRLYRPVEALFESNKRYYDPIRHAANNVTVCAPGGLCPFALASFSLSLAKGLALVAQHEEREGWRYEKVVLYRPDVLIWNKNMLFENYAGDRVTANHNRNGDFHFVMDSSQARRFGGFFCSLPQPNVRLGRTSLREFVEAVVTPGRAPDGDGFHPCL